jgi:transcriptional regulator with XRE-family HTH domain
MAHTRELTPELDLDPEAVRIGATIRTLRESIGLTLKELGAAVGRDHSHLSRVERGEKKAPRALCIAIARALGVPPAAIISPTYQAEEPTEGAA